MKSALFNRRWFLIGSIILQSVVAWPAISATNSLPATSSTEVITIPASLGFDPATLAAIEACVGEPVTFIGDAVLVIHETTLPNGSQEFVVHSNPQGAIGLGASSGTIYRLAASDTLARVIAPSGAFVTTFTANIWVIGQNGSPRFGGPILVHLTVTPDGDVTADIVMFDKGFQCIL